MTKTLLAQASDLAALRRTPVRGMTTSYTFGLADEGQWLYYTPATAATFTIPANADVAFPIGSFIDVAQWNTGTLTIQAAPGVVLYSRGLATTGGSYPMPFRYSVVRLVKTGPNNWMVYDWSEQDTGWVDLSTSNLWQTANFTSASFTAGINTAYRVKDGVLFFRLAATYVGATTLPTGTTVAGSEGNIGDLVILAAGAIPANFVPYPTSFVCGNIGVTWGYVARMDADGSVRLTTLTPGLTLPTGKTFQGAASMPID